MMIALGDGRLDSMRTSSIEIYGSGGGTSATHIISPDTAAILAPFLGKKLKMYIEVDDENIHPEPR